jgi:transcriptional antiterminator RfaH
MHASSEPLYLHPVWFAVQARPRQESLARINLQRQGYRPYLPTIAMKKRRRGRWQNVVEPLFPGYLFVQLQQGADDFAPIRSTLGVRDLVRCGQRPLPVPARLVEHLQVSVGHDEPPVPFQRGDRVRIEAGPLEGLAAVFEMPHEEDRAQVLVTLLGRISRVAVTLDALAAEC